MIMLLLWLCVISCEDNCTFVKVMNGFDVRHLWFLKVTIIHTA